MVRRRTIGYSLGTVRCLTVLSWVARERPVAYLQYFWKNLGGFAFRRVADPADRSAALSQDVQVRNFFYWQPRLPVSPRPAGLRPPESAAWGSFLSFWYKILAFTPPLRHNLTMAKTAEHLESPVTVLKRRGIAMTVFLSEGVHEHLRGLAAQNERSLSGEVRWVLKRYCDDPTVFDEG